ncbi:sensor histidine kinase [Serinicoccus kebangsaanensis]|uniref:sensor histidine kinase n=1 Tax=Serinicoccus kebangsaanensis TaxID=2602069 RepID=UPI00124D8F09|nr:HAMP domain-containing sensor histidine kinase [Serinicoccus kebangsaanensis]
MNADGHRGWTVRRRLLVMMVSMMALGIALTGVLSFAVQFRSLQDRVQADLEQEVQEVTSLAESGPEVDNEPYEEVDALLRAFLETSVASPNEAFLAVIDGQPTLQDGGERTFRVDHPDVLALVRETDVEPGRAVIDTVDTQGTTLTVMIADVQLPEEEREGTFVIAIDSGTLNGNIWRRVWTYAGVGLGSLVVAGVLAHVVLGRLLRPLRELQDATAQVSTDDLSRRVEVSGDTDITQLAHRFNAMLDRIQDGVRMQRQFLDDAAHELRTPLTILRGNAELLRPEDPAEVTATRTLMLDEVDRMQRLVDDLLVLAKAQRQDFLRPTPADVTELAVECMERVTALGERQWQLAADAEGEMRLDRHRAIQAVVQLAANAVKFSEHGSVIELRTGWVDKDDPQRERAIERGARTARRYLALSVSDHGTGIPETEQERVFERFGRASSAGQVEGSGLGLAIVSAIAEAHGGAVAVDSVEGLGSRFTIWIPVVSAPTAHRVSAPTAPPERASSLHPGG